MRIAARSESFQTDDGATGAKSVASGTWGEDFELGWLMGRSSDCPSQLRDLAVDVGFVAGIFGDDRAGIPFEHPLGRHQCIGGDGGRGETEAMDETVVWFRFSALQRGIQNAAAKQLPK